MRKLQRFGIALALTLMLTTGAFGGIIDTPPAPAPPPEPSSDMTTEPVAPATDPVVDVVLDLMQSALSLF